MTAKERQVYLGCRSVQMPFPPGVASHGRPDFVKNCWTIVGPRSDQAAPKRFYTATYNSFKLLLLYDVMIDSISIRKGVTRESAKVKRLYVLYTNWLNQKENSRHSQRKMAYRTLANDDEWSFSFLNRLQRVKENCRWWKRNRSRQWNFHSVAENQGYGLL